ISVETLSPHLLVNDCQLLGTLTVFAFDKGATDDRREVEDLEVIPGHERAAHAVGPLTASDVHALRLETGEVFKRFHLRGVVLQLRTRQAVAIAGRASG